MNINRLLREWRSKRRHERRLADWEKRGRPVPPPDIVKRRTLLSYARRFDLGIFVETGTFRGKTVEAMKPAFDRIYSIELSAELYEQATAKFRRDENIHLIHGDSGVELGALMKKIDRPALFWLDGHYSAGVTARGRKDTPILDELAHVFNAPDPGHVILIDDAREFGSDPAYPSLEELREFVRSSGPGRRIEVEHDIIRITPGDSGH